MSPVFPVGIDRTSDEVEPEGRTGAEGSKFKPRMIVAVGLPLWIVRVNEQDRSTCAAGQGAGLLVDRIAKLFDRAMHLLASLGADILLIVEHARHGHSGDSGRPRNVIDG